MSKEARFETYPQREDLGRVHTLQQHPSEGTKLEGGPMGEYGWRFKAADGKISAVGGEGFTRREDARRAIRDLAYDVVRLVIRPAHGLDLVLPIVDLDENGKPLASVRELEGNPEP